MKIRVFNLVEIYIKKINKSCTKKGNENAIENYLHISNEVNNLNSKYECLKNQLDINLKEKSSKSNDKGGIGNMSCKYSAMDIAMYVIEYANERNKPITNLYLQKILYYIQANELVETGEPIFNESIMAWKYGPVVEEVYSFFSSFGSSTIKYNNIFYNAKSIENVVKERINKIVDIKMDIPAWELVQKTHEEAPWKKLTENGKVLNKEIEIDSIREFFKENTVC